MPCKPYPLGALPSNRTIARVPVPHPLLIPQPRSMRILEGAFEISACSAIRIEPKANDGIPDLARMLSEKLQARCPIAPEVTRTSRIRPGEVSLRLAPMRSHEHNRVEVKPSGVVLTGGGPAGLYYAMQSFLQLVAQSTTGHIPALRIADWPSFRVRGFYHDVSRGKVPTRDTLLALVERLAHYKVNQLQLYIEHTFAFKGHPDIWAGSDPLTADDIRAVDDHAARHHLELVPSLSTFGHFFTALVSPRKHQLNEFPIDASQLPFSWWDRMGHYTLDCQNPASIELVREMILELRPLFRSKLFNICCDETFDLGKGRNAGLARRSGGGRLYLGFVKQIMNIVRAAGSTPMFWGDIIGNHPELVAELPRTTVALDWDYSASLKDTKARLFQRSGIPYYVCPGVCGWDRWVHDLDTATVNIISFARHGRRNGASGLLNTDWGDRGHINTLGNSMHGIALGAAAGWNSSAVEAMGFDRAFARLHWNDPSGRTTALMREAARLNVVSWRLLTLWMDSTPHQPSASWDAVTDVPVDLLASDPRLAFAAAAKLDRIAARFEKLTASDRIPDPLARREWLLGCRGQALMNRLGGWIVCLARARRPPSGVPAALDVSNAIRVFERDLSAAWHARNKPSEYWRLRCALLELARRLDLAFLRGVWMKTPRSQPPPAADVDPAASGGESSEPVPRLMKRYPVRPGARG